MKGPQGRKTRAVRQRWPVKREKARSDKIEQSEDVNQEEGERKYGDVEFADTVNNKYPVDTPEHVRAAWSYINHKDKYRQI
jgi:hypothetical protein